MIGREDNMADIEQHCQRELDLYRRKESIALRNALGRYVDPLTWWKNEENNFPSTLSYVARIVLSIPATSAPSERIFSVASSIISKQRTSMKPSIAGDIVFLNQANSWHDKVKLLMDNEEDA